MPRSDRKYFAGTPRLAFSAIKPPPRNEVNKDRVLAVLLEEFNDYLRWAWPTRILVVDENISPDQIVALAKQAWLDTHPEASPPGAHRDDEKS
jgi:hypothetical protein